MFQGFCPQTVDFMWGIRFNNERTWFEAHKQEYLDYLYRPMQALGEQIYDRMMEGSGDLDLRLRICRIYRDARRLRGRGPYKDHLWLTVERPVPEDEWSSSEPVFWFELEPEEYSYGLGFYWAPPLVMAKFRARLDRDPKPFEKLVRATEKQGLFVLEGEDYKRPKAAAPSRLLEPWYNKKCFSLACRRPLGEELYTPALADTVAEALRSLMPMYRWFSLLAADPDPRT